MAEQNVERKRFSNANTWTGILLLLVGGVLFLRQSGYPMPPWIFNWEVIVIVVGLLIGVRSGFRDAMWMIIVAVGFIFLSDDLWPGMQLKQYVIPLVIMLVGLIFIFSPKRACSGNRRHGFRQRHQQPLAMESTVDMNTEQDLEPQLDIVSIFAGIKKNILSKHFSGGQITCVFGGAEVNLINADFTSPVTINVTQVFGGTKLVVPSNWEVRSEVTAILGGIDDNRMQPPGIVRERTIILKGTIMLGGIEVNSY